MTDWPAVLRRFHALRPTQWVDRRALACLGEIPREVPVLIACSGGADSVFLTLTLCALFPERSTRLLLGHFNHGLRGIAADEDAGFVQGLGSGLGIPVEQGRAEDPLSPDEDSLRRARYHWLVQAYHRLGAGALALGHHADDGIESLLMAALSGSGPSGLASPLPVNRFADGHVRVRPLLALKREQIERTLRSIDVDWREDASNRDPHYLRNWLRREVVPVLKDRWPQDIHSAAALTRLRQEECLELLDEAVQKLALDTSDPHRLPVAALRGRPKILSRRFLTGWWLRHHAGRIFDRSVLDPLVEAIHAGTAASFPMVEGWVLILDGEGHLQLQPEKASPPEPFPFAVTWQCLSGPLFLPDGACLRAEWVDRDSLLEKPYRHADPRHEAWLAGVGPSLRVRRWQAGDRYRPLGAPGSRKLQDLFVDAKISPEQRRLLPVIEEKNRGIIWVPGFPPADDCKVCENAKKALKLTYQKV